MRGVSEIQEKRREFHHEKEIRDPITGETRHMFPASKRLARQALAIPFGIIAILCLGTIIATCFGIEIFLSEVYNGPFKSILVGSSPGFIGLADYVDLSTNPPTYRLRANHDYYADRDCD